MSKNATPAVTPQSNSVFEVLVRQAPDTKKKGKFTYISWAECLQAVKTVYPGNNDVEIKVIGFTKDGMEVEGGLPYQILFDNYAQVVVETRVMDSVKRWTLPIMNDRNQALTLDKIDSFIHNKAVMRATVKCFAIQGLGLQIFNGEDLPEVDAEGNVIERQTKASSASTDAGAAAGAAARAAMMANADPFSMGEPEQSTAPVPAPAKSEGPILGYEYLSNAISMLEDPAKSTSVRGFIAASTCSPEQRSILLDMLENRLLLIGGAQKAAQAVTSTAKASAPAVPSAPVNDDPFAM